MISILCVLVCLEIQEEQSSVCEGVSSEGMLLQSQQCLATVNIMSYVIMSTHHNHTFNCNCLSKNLTSFWKIGQRRRITAGRGVAAWGIPPPDHRQNLPSNRTAHMTNSFHSEWRHTGGIIGCLGQDSLKCTAYSQRHAVPSQVCS